MWLYILSNQLEIVDLIFKIKDLISLQNIFMQFLKNLFFLFDIKKQFAYISNIKVVFKFLEHYSPVRYYI